MDRRDNRTRFAKPEDADNSVDAEQASFVLLTPHQLKELKEGILNLVSAALIQQPKASATDPTMRKITQLVKQVSFYDPEFVLKLALYVRVDLNIRSTANYLVAVACNITSCQPYVKKYLSATIRLPSDWLDVPATYHTLPDKQLKGKSLPTCMRKALVEKFPDFDAYQLGKYNKERSIKRKLKKIKEEQAKGNKRARAPEKPQVTLKQLIRQLHISTPHLQVMCLIGKKYPSTEAEFRVSGLYGNFEHEKAGRRMKLPTPETWETLLSEKGNKSSTWEELIEHKKLPFMAMIRNIKNLIYAGVHPRYHRWVQNKLSNQQTVAQSKQFPFQFFSAYEVVPKNMDEFKKIMAGEVEDKKAKKGAAKPADGKPATEKRKKKKPIVPTHMPNDKIFEDYRKAIDQAVKHATTYNVNPIKGSTVVFCNVSSETRGQSPGAKGMGSSVRSVQEIGYLLGLMCKYVCEDCDFRVWSSAGPSAPGVTHLPVTLKEGSILDNMAAVAEVAALLGDAPGEFPFGYLEEMIRDKRRVDNLLVLSHHVINPSDSSGGNSKLANLLNKYRQEVNHDLLFVSVDLSGSGKSAIGQDEKHPQDIQITGFSDQILRFIAERGDTNQLQYVEHIDEAKKLIKKQAEAVEISPWWRFIETLGDDLVFPNVTVGQKWREARVFISSTFIDMHGERDILTRVVLPEIKEKAKQRRVNVFEVDLRWGVTEEESASGKSIQLCLDEVDRCRPFFIGMLGERYGWAPEAYDVPDHPRFHWLKDYPRGRSITELEMHFAALANPGAAPGAFFYMRDNLFMDKVPDNYQRYFEAGPPGAAQKMAELKQRIKASGVNFYEHYPCQYGGVSEDGHPSVSSLDFFGERVFHDLWGAISERFPAEAAPSNFLELERSFHQAFVHETTRNFVGRKDTMSAMSKFVQGYHHQLMVLVGKPGDGKSSLMANFASQYATQNPRTFVLSHFIGASPTSSDIQSTLQRLCLELKTVFDLPDEIPTDFKELTNVFASLMEQASFKGKLVIIIDAVNQLDHKIQRAHTLEWLPTKLPCKFIISTTPGKAHENLVHRFASAYTEISMAALDLSDRQALVRQTLWQYHKKLDERPMNNQMRELLKKADSGNPLYLMVACEELRVFGLYEQVNERIKRMSPQIPRLLEEVLKRLETDHGAEIIQNICSLLVASRGGLLEHELISMVPVDGFKWAALMRSLSPFLKPTGDSGEISFFHDSFKDAIRKKYFLIKKSESRYHGMLADYFQNNADPHLDGSWLGGGDKHSVSELPYHLVCAERWNDLEKVLCDLNFIELKAMHGMILGLVSDYQAATAEGLKYDGLAKVSDFSQFVKANAHVLAINPALTFQQAANQPNHTAPAIKANNLWNNLQETRSWVGWRNKPKENDPCKMTFSGHPEAVSACDFSQGSNKLIACATRDCAIHLYNSDSGVLVSTLVGHSGYIPALKFSSDGAQLVSCSWDGSIIVWDVRTELPLKVLTGHDRRVNDIAFSHDGQYLASASWDTTVKIYNTSADFKCIHTFPTGEKPVNTVAWSADDKSVLAGCWDGLIKMYSLEDDHHGELLATMSGHSKSVQSLSCSPSGKHFISGSMDQRLLLWDAKAKKFISTLSVQSKPISSVTYAADGTHLLSASLDATVKVWDANLGRELRQWTSASGFMTTVAFNPNNDQIMATGSSECAVTIWDLANSVELFVFPDSHRRPITCLEFSPNGKFLVSGSEDGTLLVWDAELGTQFYQLKGPAVSVTGVSWSPNGQLIAASSDDFAIRIYDFTTGVEVQNSPFRGHDSAVRSVSFAPNGTSFVSASRDNSLRTWDIRTGKQTSIYRGHTDWITSVAYSPTGKRMASCGWDNTVRLWNPRKPAAIAVLEGHDGAVVSVRFSPDGAFIASCSYDGTVKIWDAKSATEITSLCGHKGSVNSISFNTRGDKLASVGDDTTIRIWNPLTATEVATLIGHSQPVHAATFSTNNQIATGSTDKTMKIWDVGIKPVENADPYASEQPSTKKISEEIRGHNATINHLALSNNGNYLLTVSDDKTGAIWNIERNVRMRTIQLDNNATFKCCQWSKDAKLFVTASDDGAVNVWDTRTGKIERKATTHAGPATSVSLNSNGFTLVSGGWDNVCQTSDLRKVGVASVYRGHSDWILSTATIPNFTHFASGGWDNTVKLWKSENNSTNLVGHIDTVTSVAVSPDARFIASGSYDSTVKLWSVASSSLERTLAGHVGKVNKVVFTPKADNLVLSAGQDHIVKLWDVATGNLKNEFVCQGPATALDAVTSQGELLMVFADAIGNICITKLFGAH